MRARSAESGAASAFSAMLSRILLSSVAGAAMLAGAMPAAAQTTRATDTRLRDSFQIGSSEGALCRVQSDLNDSALTSIYDRSWTIICRDAAEPVGKIFALRGDAMARIVARPGALSCEPVSSTDGGIPTAVCAGPIPGMRMATTRGDTTYVAEGIGAYRDALRIGLNSIMAGSVASGTIRVATTSVGESAALARLQIARLPVDRALAEGYRRNNAGDYAEASVYFEALEERRNLGDSDIDPSEFILNRALQSSNLGDFANADRLFAEVDGRPTADPVQLRLRRNFHAIHQLNQRDLSGAMATLAVPVAPIGIGAVAANGEPNISAPVAAGLNSGATSRALRQYGDRDRLSPEERAVIIDAQAEQLRGTIERLQGNFPAARSALEHAQAQTLTVRDGRVTSIIRLQAQIMGEIALAYEGENALGNAEAQFVAAIDLLQREYPETQALAAARAKFAAFLTRHDRNEEALANYRQVVTNLTEARRQLTGVYNQMTPYYRLLVERQASDPDAAAEFFTAVQLLVRPGVADTQAQLARELSAGSNDASALFRQANSLSRDIERARIDLARYNDSATPVPQPLRDEVVARIANLSSLQTETLAQLSQYPQYRAVAQDSITLAELQGALRADEAYAKIAVVGDALFGILVTPTGAQAWQMAISRQQLDAAVDQIRNSVSVFEGGQYITYPFDAEASHKLFTDLFGPAATAVAASHHLIFEPDGAMLRLPVGLLITDDASIAAYRARTNAPGGDPFDMRGVQWLARSTHASTAVSPVAFRNTRAAPASRATMAYAGFGNNLPASDAISIARTRSGDQVDADCNWSLSQWNRPISPAELYDARNLIGVGGAEVVTGAAFTDQAIMNADNLAQYRILHFATHGLVTPPRPQCSVKPALLTSFGTSGSDGLLSFDEIFRLRLDADLVILSACDTAGEASIAATRAAGVTTGGGTALDGLVRAFIGAGGRSVLASHWPAPDDFNATSRLIGGLFRAAPGESVADALGNAQAALMDDVATSHPYYWAGFAIIGDGGQALQRSATPTPSTTAANMVTNPSTRNSR